MQLKKPKLILGSALVILILVVTIVERNLPTVKYGIRKINIVLFQAGEVAGGTITQVPAKFHRQEHTLSCEIASLKMALSVYGFDIAESELISKLNFDPTPRTKTTWGNPFTGFVGNIDGKMIQDGYGVYWDPIADVAKLYTHAEDTQFDPIKLATEINQGHPVVSWGYAGAGKRVSWIAPSGSRIDAVNGEHARTITGFTGSVTNPTGFIILDPIYGKLYWKTADLMHNWEPFGNMGVVVYPKSI